MKKRELIEIYMFLSCVNHDFARKRWLRSMESLSFCSFKGLPQGNWNYARWDPKRVTDAGLFGVMDGGRGGVRGIAGWIFQARPGSEGRNIGLSKA